MHLHGATKNVSSISCYFTKDEKNIIKIEQKSALKKSLHGKKANPRTQVTHLPGTSFNSRQGLSTWKEQIRNLCHVLTRCPMEINHLTNCRFHRGLEYPGIASGYLASLHPISVECVT